MATTTGYRTIQYECDEDIWKTNLKNVCYDHNDGYSKGYINDGVSGIIYQNINGKNNSDGALAFMPLKRTKGADTTIPTSGQYDTSSVTITAKLSAHCTAYLENGNTSTSSTARLKIHSSNSKILFMRSGQSVTSTSFTLSTRINQSNGFGTDTTNNSVLRHSFPTWLYLNIDNCYIESDNHYIEYWKVNKSIVLTITIAYTYNLPSINSISKFTASPINNDESSRKVHFSWNYVGWNGGQKPTSQTTSTGVIYEIRDSSDADKILYKSDLVTKTSGSDSTDEYPLIFLKEGESAREYTLTAYLNNNTSQKTVSDPAATASVYAPVIDGWQSPPNEAPIRFILQNSDDETMQDISHSGGILTGDSLVIQWAKPKIKYASELYVNFQVLLSKNKKDFEVIHWHYANKTNCPQVKSGSIELNDKGYDETNDDYYKYQYVFNKEEMRRHNVQNYERVYLAIRPVIVGKYNGVIFNGNESGNITWRDGATKMAFDNTINSTTNAKAGMVPTPSQYDWQDFICVFECNVSYCPDGFKWVKCLMYYCNDGITWKPVIARWSPDGSYWVYC